MGRKIVGKLTSHLHAKKYLCKVMVFIILVPTRTFGEAQVLDGPRGGPEGGLGALEQPPTFLRKL
jgi:hypothetical protein